MNSLNKEEKDNNYINKDILYLVIALRFWTLNKNRDEYYRGISSANYIKYINKSLLVIDSKDDSICTHKWIYDDILENKSIIVFI